jgi:solute carrier family 35 protein E1
MYNPDAGMHAPANGWGPRRESFAYHNDDPRNGGGGGSKHERQKSLSDAFHNIRTRRSSMSTNAHELADALKAPISPKLIVGQPAPAQYLHHALTSSALLSADAVYHLVYDLSTDQYLFEIHS